MEWDWMRKDCNTVDHERPEYVKLVSWAAIDYAEHHSTVMLNAYVDVGDIIEDISFEEACKIAEECPELVYCIIDPSDVENEFSRVFGRPAEVLRGRKDNTEVLVLVEGWIEPIWYNAGEALNVLRRFDDEAGKTAEGDAEVCEALEKAGASLGFDIER